MEILGWELPCVIRDFWGLLRLGLRDVWASGKDTDNFDKNNLLSSFWPSDLAGLMDLADGASSAENRKICCITTRPTGVQWEGEPGILLKVKGSYNQKFLEQHQKGLSVPI